MPVSPSDAEVVLRFYEAVCSGDENAIRDELAPDATWWVPTGRFAGTHEGADAVTDYLLSMREFTGGTLRPWSEDSRDVAVGDAHIVLIDRIVASREGATLDSSEAWVMAFRGGRIGRVIQYALDREHFSEFWA